MIFGISVQDDPAPDNHVMHLEDAPDGLGRVLDLRAIYSTPNFWDSCEPPQSRNSVFSANTADPRITFFCDSSKRRITEKLDSNDRKITESGCPELTILSLVLT